MNRRTLFQVFSIGGIGVGAMIGWRGVRNRERIGEVDPEDSDRRVRFLCSDNHGLYSPSIYLRVGGGRRAFELVREAAPLLRPEDVGSSAAGLCGFLFQKFHFDRETGGTMSLDSPPTPRPDGTIDWEGYSGDCDIIVINADTRSAKCVYGIMAGEEIRDLPLGMPKVGRF